MTLSRRALVLGSALPLLGAGGRFRFAICNETFEGKSFEEGCRLARQTGYAGLEIAPATLAGDPAELSQSRRKQLRATMASAGVAYAGLHSLMTAPGAALHLTTPDDAVRKRSWEYYRLLIDLSGDLGGGVMVLGSGKQRSATGGSSLEDASKRLRDGLAVSADHARERGVLLLLEPLSPQFTDVVNTVGQAVAMVRAINHPAVSSMIDTHNTVAETEPHGEVIRKHIAHIRHVHVNELDGRHPGTGNYDFASVLRALRKSGYGGWVSLEVFQFKPSGETIARETMALLRRIEKELEGDKT